MQQALAGSGTMADLTRAYAARETPLGPLASWPVSLRSALSLMLESRFPMSVWWGSSLRLFYNDAYVPVLAGKHPDAIGEPAAEVWQEIWHILGPQTRRVLQGEGATWNEHLLLPMQRKGFLEETYFTFSYSPLREDAGRIAGVLVTCQETTAQVQGERQLQLLRDLAARTAGEQTADGVCAAAGAVLDAAGVDLPFALVYRVDDTGQARLCASAGFGAPASSLAAARAAWPFETAAAQPGGMLLIDVATGFGPLPCGPWDRPPAHAAVMALKAGIGARPLGWLVAGLNPLREVDPAYSQLFRLAADQIARALAGAHAFEEERRRVEALAAIDRQKSAFFSNISHEFRTPLTLMIGPTEDALGSPQRALAGDALEAVYRNELRLLKLVNTLLDFARLQAGRMVAAPQPTDLAQLTIELASAFRSAFERAGLRFTVDCHDVGEVCVDRDMWERIVLNLLSNALKFTFDGGVALRLSATDGHIDLAVQDSGVGIAAADLPHVFERFHRIEGARARTLEGSGIGLALVRDLVRLHGGDCAVRSEPGSGTTVTVSLPQAGAQRPPGAPAADMGPVAASSTTRRQFELEALSWLDDDARPPVSADTLPAAAARSVDGNVPQDETEPPADPQSALLPGRVLVVDDNADMLRYLQRLLRRHWQVDSARDGLEALEAVRRRLPDVVLTDVMMPRLDGLGLLRALRADERSAALPVIMLSARAGEEARVEGVELGADDYLVKPFSARELIARVNSQLRLLAAARERAGLLERERHARAEAEAQRQQLRAIFDQAPTLIAVFRGPAHVVELANDRICRAWGLRQADLLGRPFFEAAPEAADQPWRELLDGVYRSGRAHVGREVPAQFASGSDGVLQTAYYDFVWAPLHVGGRVDGVIVVATDVSAQVMARRELSGLREAAEEANRAKDEFLAMLGHELRNPLAPIATALQLMKLRGVDAVERERAIIERQVRHMVRLVDDLLEVSRITRGKVKLRRRHVELVDVVAKAIEMASPLLEQQRHDLQVDVPTGGLGVFGDADRLAQVVSNLLNNAAKYTEPGGRVQVSGGLEEGQVVLRVSDTGVGIAPDMLARIFELFVQQGQMLDRSRGGLGLGLAIARSLVVLHGGSLSAASAGEGRGSTFTIRLPPAQRGENLPSSASPVSPAPGAGADLPRVLVVDDNVDAADMLAEILSSLGFGVRAAYDGPAALALAPLFRPDVALLDIGLPVMDGYELARRLAHDRRLGDLRLVALTGYGQAQDRQRSSEAGFHAHLVKPVDVAELRELLLRLVPARPPG